MFTSGYKRRAAHAVCAKVFSPFISVALFVFMFVYLVCVYVCVWAMLPEKSYDDDDEVW